jgi:geranylgeranyl reductase family protein
LPNDFEVGIVGAGPAGSCCAKVLGEAGIKTALFDHSHPREKPCGGLIDSRVVKEFNIPKELVQNEIKWFLAERFGFRAKFSFKPSMYLTARKDFDHYLLKRVLGNKEVAFFDEKVVHIGKKNGRWIILTNKDRHVMSRVLIGADGCPSLIRKHVSRPIPKEFLAMTVGYDFSSTTRFIERRFFRNTIEAYYSRKYVRKIGFLWIFPKRDSIHVGIGGIEEGKKLKDSLDYFMQSHPDGKRLRNLKGRFFAHLIPAVWQREFFDLECSGDDWALIGDAAGHVNPLSGVGIYYAMKGGTLCALAYLDGDIHRFEKNWRKEYGGELYYGAGTTLRYYSNLSLFSWFQSVLKDKLSRLRLEK